MANVTKGKKKAEEKVGLGASGRFFKKQKGAAEGIEEWREKTRLDGEGKLEEDRNKLQQEGERCGGVAPQAG